MGTIKFLTDEDFNNIAVRGIRAKLPGLDLLRVQEAGLRMASDREVMKIAAESGRVVLSHDERTMADAAVSRINAGLKMPGLFLVPQRTDVGRIIAAVILLAECSRENEWQDRIEYLPL